MAIAFSPKNYAIFFTALSPILIISYLLMDSAFNANLRAIIFIVGLVVAQFIGIGMRFIIPKNKKPWILEGRPPNDSEKAAHDVLSQLGVSDPVLDIAMQLEKVALNDEYFIQRGLYPNVDFYSGIIYRALGIPTDMFTVMFALGRLPGWIAQWKEMRENHEPIGRPRQIYTGANERPYISLNDR